MRQKNIALGKLFEICEENGLEGRYLHELFLAARGKVLDLNASFYLKSNDWINDYNLCTQKGLDLLKKVNDHFKKPRK